MAVNIAIAGLGLAVAAMTTVSIGAEASLPGDMLYPVKTSINENIRSAANFSAEAQADWERERAERRIEEAQTLYAEGRMTPELEAELKTKVSTHWEAAQQILADVEAEGDTEKAARIRTSLSSTLGLYQKAEDKTTNANDRARERADAHAGLDVDAVFHGLFLGHFKRDAQSSSSVMSETSSVSSMSSTSSVSSTQSSADIEVESDTETELEVDDNRVNGSIKNRLDGTVNLD